MNWRTPGGFMFGAGEASGHGGKAARWLHIALLGTAFAGWLIFILACVGGPAWSPDGSQILFAYRDVENARASVALYDRNRNTVRAVFAQPIEDDKDEVFVHPRWQMDGKRALIALFSGTPDGSENGCALISIPIKSKIPLQLYNLGKTAGCVYAYPQMGDQVYFAEKDLRSVDLKSGEVKSEKFKVGGQDSPEEEVVLSESKHDLRYQRMVRRPKKTGDPQPSDEYGQEVGIVQLSDTSLKASFTFWESDLPALGLESSASDLSPIAMAPNEATGAMIATKNGKESDRILLTEESRGIVRVLSPDLGRGRYCLGNLVWSLDGSTLYASVLTKGESKEVSNYWLAEIPVDSGKARMTMISAIQHEMADDFGGDFMDTFRFSMDVALSPDGRWIAATPAVLGKKELNPRDRALFLVDLRDPGRKMKRVPVPHEAAE